MRMARVFCFLLLSCLATLAWSLDRPFPLNAKRGVLSMEDYPTIRLNGEERRLSVGAWIRNERNTIDTPVSLRGKRYTVNYTENGQGEIDRVWLLSDEEAAQPAPADRPKPSLPR
jgi:hypothetical protein